MAAMSNYLENKLIDHIFRSTSYTPPTTIAIALCTAAPTDASTGATITEVSGGSYARFDLGSPNNSTWSATQGGTSGASSGTTGTTGNAVIITFPTASADWGTVTHIAICDSAVIGEGNVLFHGALPASQVISSGQTFSFPIDYLQLQID